MDADGLSMEGDRRGKHGNYPRKIAPEARKAVVDFILSHSPTESHYKRARTRKRYFESHISMHNMWTDFIAKHSDFKTALPVPTEQALASVTPNFEGFLLKT